MGGVDLHLAIFCWLTLVCDFHFPISPLRMKPNSLISDQFIARYRGLYQRYLQHFWPAWLLIVKAIQEHNFSFLKNTTILFLKEVSYFHQIQVYETTPAKSCTGQTPFAHCVCWRRAASQDHDRLVAPLSLPMWQMLSLTAAWKLSMWYAIYDHYSFFFSFFHLRQGILYSNPSGNRLDL